MTACLSFRDIMEVGRPQIEEMRRIGDAYPDANAPGARVVFTRQVRIVEGIASSRPMGLPPH